MRALLHFSEDPNIAVFRPHVPASSPHHKPLVWTVDEEHAPGFWFPRDCPRSCCWSIGKTTSDAGRALLGQGTRMHAIETGWLDRMRTCKVFVYRFDPAPFAIRMVPEAGYWATEETVIPLSVEPAGDLLALHANAGIELRVVENLWPVIDAIVGSGLEFSISRSKNALLRASS
jgi:hypothetical protein